MRDARGIGRAVEWIRRNELAARDRTRWTRRIDKLCLSGRQAVVRRLFPRGTLNFVRGIDPRAVLRWAAPAALLYALLSVTLSGPILNGVMILQTPLIAGSFFHCAWLFLRLRASRTTTGSRTTGVVFAAIAAIWVSYAVAFLIGG